MLRRTSLLIAATALAVLAAPAAPARAGMATTSQVQDFGSPASPLDFNFQQALAFEKFDPGLGKLTGVAITIDATLAATASGHYAGGTPEAISIYSFAKVAVTAPDGSTLPVALSVRDLQTLGGGPAAGFSEALQDTESATLEIPAADLGQFVGPGTLSFAIVGSPRVERVGGLAITSGILFGGGQGAGSVQPRGYGAVTVVYQFAGSEPQKVPGPTAVPEPGSLALLVTGLAGLIAHARLRRREANGTPTPPGSIRSPDAS